MALRALMLRKKIDDKKKELAELEGANDFNAREAELEASIAEAQTEEEKRAVEEAIDTFETEKAEAQATISSLTDEIRGLETELEAEEAKQDTPQVQPEAVPEERKDTNTMSMKRFFSLDAQQRDAFFARDDVKTFLSNLRSLKGGEKRTVTGGDLLIPTVVLDLIKENITEYSKLYKHVRVRNVPGKARQTVAGAIPEGVWTEMCATLNELAVSYTGVEVDGYKVGGYIPVCNALLEDSDINLATEVITMLGAAIGLALDKAILYGTGTKMPLGVMARLVMTETSTRLGNIPFVDVHSTNIQSIAATVTDTKLIQNIITDAGAAKGKYSRGAKTWVMNEQTYSKLLAASMAVNAAGAIVAGMNGTLPIIGGDIEVLEFIPDNVIIGGYFDLYLLAERAGTAIAQSEHAQFIEDNTVFKATARYDGLPVIGEAFVAIGINGVTPNATMTFAQDTANSN